MATLAELAALRTSLDRYRVGHLVRLVASWSLLADLAFSDMVLMAKVDEPTNRGDAPFVVLAQVRPNNRSTLLEEDLVGTSQPVDEWPLVKLAFENGSRVVGEGTVTGVAGTVPIWCVPVTLNGQVVAVMVRFQGPVQAGSALYEKVYLSIFERLCTMVSDGVFPFREEDVAGPGLPRVGDGVILMDGEGAVEFATPNAANALHRLGIYASAEGRTLRELGLRARVVERALEYALPTIEEIDRGSDVAILFHCVPLIELGKVTGVLARVRDVSDLRKLDRIVLSKEAAVREVHHRVKNNLQTISSLLRLQSRRSSHDETRQALDEAERRVRSIAVVHEVLSREPGEDVVFDDIVNSLVALVNDTVVALHPVEVVVQGELGVLPTDFATPLAIVLTELLTNAVEHAFNDAAAAVSRAAIITLALRRHDGRAIAEIRDNGRGLGENFSLEAPTSLGLSIVRDLVRVQLAGTLEMRSVGPDEGGGTYVRVVVPLADEGRDEDG